MQAFTVRNPFGPLWTTEMASALNIAVAKDGSGQLTPVYELDDEAEAEALRKKGYIVEPVTSAGQDAAS